MNDEERVAYQIASSVSGRWAIIKAIEEKWDEKGKATIIEALKEAGHKAAENGLKVLHSQGKSLNQEIGKVNDVHVYTELMANGRTGFQHDYDVVEVNPKLAIHILYNCPDVETFKKLKCPNDVCVTYFGAVEQGIMEALNPKMKGTWARYLYRGPDSVGDPFCMIVVEIRD